MTLGPGQARFKHFPGASSKDLLHYIDATLEEQNFEAAIIHIGINDILYDNMKMIYLRMGYIYKILAKKLSL